MERLKKWKEGGKAAPLLMDINPTDRCNLNCKSCWQRNPKFKNLDSSYELSDEKLQGIVEEAMELGVKEFEITGGGEPLMRKDLVLELMGKIKKWRKSGNITTNGTLLRKSDLKKILEMEWDSITFSVDGPDAKTNDYLRGRGTLSSIKKSLDFLKENKKNAMNLKFNTVISNKNYDKLKEMLELANQFDVNIVSFETLTVHSDIGKKLKLNKNERAELIKLIPEIKNEAEKLNIETNIGKFKNDYFRKSNRMEENMEVGKDFSSIPCYEPWYHLVVKVDGSVQPCCLFDSKKENVKERSLKNIWFGKHFSKIRKNIREGNFPKYCKICNASQVIANKELRKRLKD